MLSPKSHAFLNSRYGNLPRQRRVAGDSSVTLHPDDAAKRQIREGMLLRVFNDRGSFEAVARISDEVKAGVVVAPFGYWRKLSRSASAVNAFNSLAFADLGKAPTISNNLVEVAVAR